MNNCTTCDIVMELLPLYSEQKTGEESNRYIKEHLEVCPSCKEVHDLMNAEYLEFQGATDRMGKRKGHKRRTLSPSAKRWLLLGVGLLGYLCLMGGLVVFTFCYLVV